MEKSILCPTSLYEKEKKKTGRIKIPTARKKKIKRMEGPKCDVPWQNCVTRDVACQTSTTMEDVGC